MVFKKQDPWEAMQARGKKSLSSNLNDDGDDPYAKGGIANQRAAKYRQPAPKVQTMVPNKRFDASRTAVSKRQITAAGGRPSVGGAKGRPSAGARPSVSSGLYKTTDKKNKFGNKSAANLGNDNFVDISDQDEAGLLPDWLSGFFYDKSVGGPQRDLESVIAVQLFFATFVLTPIGAYFFFFN